MSKRTSKASEKRSRAKSSTNAGPIAFCVALIIIALGAIQLISTFHTYAMNLAQLESLKKQESSLTAQKHDLENDISRWDDKAYVIAQARERLGFVFEGETPIKVEHPEAVTGKNTDPDDAPASKTTTQTTLPWYSELAYSLREADKEKSATHGESAQEPEQTSGESAQPTQPSQDIEGTTQ